MAHHRTGRTRQPTLSICASSRCGLVRARAGWICGSMDTGAGAGWNHRMMDGVGDALSTRGSGAVDVGAASSVVRVVVACASSSAPAPVGDPLEASWPLASPAGPLQHQPGRQPRRQPHRQPHRQPRCRRPTPESSRRCRPSTDRAAPGCPSPHQESGRRSTSSRDVARSATVGRRRAPPKALDELQAAPRAASPAALPSRASVVAPATRRAPAGALLPGTRPRTRSDPRCRPTRTSRVSRADPS